MDIFYSKFFFETDHQGIWDHFMMTRKISNTLKSVDNNRFKSVLMIEICFKANKLFILLNFIFIRKIICLAVIHLLQDQTKNLLWIIRGSLRNF